MSSFEELNGRSVSLLALTAAVSLILVSHVSSQTFKTVYTFTATGTNASGLATNNDGAGPYSSLAVSGNTLYGTTFKGGASGVGTVFAVNTDGSGFRNLHNFGGYPSDGASPFGGMILSGSTLYGTAMSGGSFVEKGHPLGH